MSLYEQDTYAWSLQTAQAIREKRFDAVDWESVAEEILDVGKSERRELNSRVVQILLHLLKARYQPDKHTRSWDDSLRVQRADLELVLKQNPSLKRELSAVIAEVYEAARSRAIKQTRLEVSVFPSACPFTEKEVLGL